MSLHPISHWTCLVLYFSFLSSQSGNVSLRTQFSCQSIQHTLEQLGLSTVILKGGTRKYPKPSASQDLCPVGWDESFLP